MGSYMTLGAAIVHFRNAGFKVYHGSQLDASSPRSDKLSSEIRSVLVEEQVLQDWLTLRRVGKDAKGFALEPSTQKAGGKAVFLIEVDKLSETLTARIDALRDLQNVTSLQTPGGIKVLREVIRFIVYGHLFLPKSQPLSYVHLLHAGFDLDEEALLHDRFNDRREALLLAINKIESDIRQGAADKEACVNSIEDLVTAMRSRHRNRFAPAPLEMCSAIAALREWLQPSLEAAKKSGVLPAPTRNIQSETGMRRRLPSRDHVQPHSADQASTTGGAAADHLGARPRYRGDLQDGIDNPFLRGTRSEDSGNFHNTTLAQEHIVAPWKIPQSRRAREQEFTWMPVSDKQETK